MTSIILKFNGSSLLVAAKSITKNVFHKTKGLCLLSAEDRMLTITYRRKEVGVSFLGSGTAKFSMNVGALKVIAQSKDEVLCSEFHIYDDHVSLGPDEGFSVSISRLPPSEA